MSTRLGTRFTSLALAALMTGSVMGGIDTLARRPGTAESAVTAQAPAAQQVATRTPGPRS